jgi:hypothetical protein
MNKLLPILLILVACGCATSAPRETIFFHLPGYPVDNCHLYVTIDAAGNFEVVKRYRSFHVSDPDKGTKISKGRISGDAADRFLLKLSGLKLQDIDQEDVESRMAASTNRIFVADGLEFTYRIDTPTFKGRWSKNGLSTYADHYSHIAELRLLMNSLANFRDFAFELYEKGQPQQPSEPHN